MNISQRRSNFNHSKTCGQSIENVCDLRIHQHQHQHQQQWQQQHQQQQQRKSESQSLSKYQSCDVTYPLVDGCKLNSVSASLTVNEQSDQNIEQKTDHTIARPITAPTTSSSIRKVTSPRFGYCIQDTKQNEPYDYNHMVKTPSKKLPKLHRPLTSSAFPQNRKTMKNTTVQNVSVGRQMKQINQADENHGDNVQRYHYQFAHNIFPNSRKTSTKSTKSSNHNLSEPCLIHQVDELTSLVGHQMDLCSQFFSNSDTYIQV